MRGAGRGAGMSASSWWQYVGLAILATATVVLCYLALTRDPDPPSGGRGQDASAQSPDPSATPSTAPDPNTPPQVVDQVRTAFASTPALPPGAQTYDNDATGSPLAVRRGALTHARPKAPVAIGSLEVQLSGEVQKLGARVVFPDRRSGSVNLVAWRSSLVDARQADQPVPESGLRLVVYPDAWQLTTYVKQEVAIAGGEFPRVSGPATVEIYRSGSRAWVVDPTGKVTRVNDARIGQLAGPWACWQLVEETRDLRPARVEEIWAG